MSRIKVCHFSSVHAQTDTRVFYRECRSLARIYDVTFVGIGNFTGVKDGVKLIGIPKPANYLVRYFHTLFIVFLEALKTEASIYHIHDAEMVPFGIVLSLAGKKVIYDIHENTYQDILLKPWLPSYLRKILAFCYNLLLRAGTHFMHYIVVVADPMYLKDFFVKKNQYTIIQNFADLEALEQFVVPNRNEIAGNNLFYIGSIRDLYYDIAPVFDAMYLLKQKGITVNLHCIGIVDAEMEADITKNEKWNAISSQIIFYGFKPIEEAYEISRICKVGICLKDQPEEILVSHERKLFEYMAIGLPSIFCDSHIYRELNHKCGIGISVDLAAPAAIAAAIEKLIISGEMLAEFSDHNLHWANQEFNWSHEEKKLLADSAKAVKEVMDVLDNMNSSVAK